MKLATILVLGGNLLLFVLYSVGSHRTFWLIEVIFWHTFANLVIGLICLINKHEHVGKLFLLSSLLVPMVGFASCMAVFYQLNKMV